jgi:hypothetical protein
MGCNLKIRNAKGDGDVSLKCLFVKTFFERKKLSCTLAREVQAKSIYKLSDPNSFLKRILFLTLTLAISTLVLAQYPFDKFAKPAFKEYNNWKLIDKQDEKKIHQTVTIADFYSVNTSLTIQFTIDNSTEKPENIIRIYKGNTTIQSFRNDVVDYMPNYIAAHPIKVADLNGDGLTDIKITYGYNSNGLSLSYRLIYLLQNTDGTFIKYSFDNMFEGRTDFERDLDADGKFEILAVKLVGINEHSYWCFTILKLEKSSITDQSATFDYPIFIQFLHQKNYKQAL